jgi:hypothetical protein
MLSYSALMVQAASLVGVVEKRGILALMSRKTIKRLCLRGRKAGDIRRRKGKPLRFVAQAC